MFTGVVNGSAGGADMDLLTGSNDYQITGADLGTSGEVTGGWLEIENLTGLAASADVFTVAGGNLSGTADGLSAGDGDLLIGDTTYSITGADSGFSGSVTAWANIENLTGTGLDDVFTVASGTLSGTINGLGPAASDRLEGDTSYTVNGPNAGFSASVFAWINIEDIHGTAGADMFNFSAGGTLTGFADGLPGMDTFNINGAGTAAVSLIGGTDADTFNLNGNVFTGVVDGSAGGADMDLLTGSNDYQITGADLGTSGEVTGGWTEIESLVGTAGVDVFTVAGGALSGTADGLAMSDTLAGDTLYTVTGANSGTSASVAVWQMIENVTGTGGVDMFDFSAGG